MEESAIRFGCSSPNAMAIKQLKPIAIIEQDAKKRIAAIISAIKKQKGQSLVLVPEVAMLARCDHLGTVYHAGLKQSEKKRIWQSVYSGETTTIIGTQKALFLPFQNLQCVVIDEEQYESYKLWDQYPRLHTVRAAKELARMWGAQIVYGSSFPSLSLMHAIDQKQAVLKNMDPVELHCEILPYSFDDRKYKRPLPNDASTVIRAAARQGKRVLVLYNRKDNAKLMESLSYRLSKSAKANITLGTSAVLSMHREGLYECVIWIAPELTLRAIDYRSGERARITASRLQLLARNKRILVCTKYQNMAKDALAVPSENWQKKTFAERKRLYLPPYADLVRLTVRDISSKKAQKRAQDVRQELFLTLEDFAHVFGPYQQLGKQQGKYHEYHILLSGELPKLYEAYRSLPIDSADADPHRIV